jgi:hypothetical protein
MFLKVDSVSTFPIKPKKEEGGAGAYLMAVCEGGTSAMMGITEYLVGTGRGEKTKAGVGASFLAAMRWLSWSTRSSLVV